MVPPPRCLTSRLIVLALAVMLLPALVLCATPSAAHGKPASPATAAPDPSGYLVGRTLDIEIPAAPATPDALDIAGEVDARSASEDRRRQAFDDAGAYGYAALLPRFSEAAGTNLDPATSPILALVLRRVLVDLTGTQQVNGRSISGYVPAAKAANPRPRPFVVDNAGALPGLSPPCESDYLWADAGKSYPSGHAAEGWAAALLLADVIPERKSLLLARGLRFGDNRVVCGVHWPSDVAEGRRIAGAYMAIAEQDPGFRHDLECAIAERRRQPGSPDYAAHKDDPEPCPGRVVAPPKHP